MGFPMGKLVCTAGINDKMADSEAFSTFVRESIGRHGRQDWGDLDPDDRNTNDDALNHGGRLFSAYEHQELPKIWIITEWNRSATTVLFPDEY